MQKPLYCPTPYNLEIHIIFHMTTFTVSYLPLTIPCVLNSPISTDVSITAQRITINQEDFTLYHEPVVVLQQQSIYQTTLVISLVVSLTHGREARRADVKLIAHSTHLL